MNPTVHNLIHGKFNCMLKLHKSILSFTTCKIVCIFHNRISLIPSETGQNKIAFKRYKLPFKRQGTQGIELNLLKKVTINRHWKQWGSLLQIFLGGSLRGSLRRSLQRSLRGSLRRSFWGSLRECEHAGRIHTRIPARMLLRIPARIPARIFSRIPARIRLRILRRMQIYCRGSLQEFHLARIYATILDLFVNAPVKKSASLSR